MFGLLTRWATVCYWLEDHLDHVFGRLGRVVGRRPGLVFVLSLLCSLGFGAGLVNLTPETSIEKLWIPQDSIAIDHRTIVTSTFGDPAVAHAVIVTGGDPEAPSVDLLTATSLSLLRELHEHVTSTPVVSQESGEEYVYGDVCERPGGPQSACYDSSLLEWFGPGGRDLDAFLASGGDLYERINDPTAVDASGIPLNITSVVGDNTSYDDDGRITLITAARMLYATRGETGDWQLFFLDTFLDPEKELGIETGKLNFAVLADRSVEDELDRVVGGDIYLFGICFGLIFAFMIFALSGRPPIESRVLVSVAGVWAIILAILAGFGICSAAGLFFSPMTQVLPFLIVGIGVDDIFVLVNALDGTDPAEPLEKRMETTLRESGVAIFATSVTDAVAFLCGSMTRMPAIREFCFFAATTIMADFLITITFFAACVTWDERRKAASRSDCVPCLRVRGARSSVHRVKVVETEMAAATDEPTPLPTQGDAGDAERRGLALSMASSASSVPALREVGSGHVGHKKRETAAPEYSGAMSRLIDTYYTPLILGPAVRALTFVFFLILLGVAIFGSTRIVNEFSATDVAPDDSYIVPYIDLSTDLFSHIGEGVFVVVRDVEYHDENDAARARRLAEELLDVSDVLEGPVSFWYLDFVDGYLPQAFPADTPMSEELFYAALQSFLQTPQGAFYVRDISFADSSNRTIVASRMHTRFIPTVSNSRRAELMVDARDDVNSFDVDAFPFSGNFVFYEQFLNVEGEVLTNLIAAGAAVFVVTLIILIHPGTALIILAILVSINFGILGSMPMWGVRLNSVSVVTLVLALGISVDYNLHIAHGYMSSTAETRAERVRDSLRTLGSSVVLGGMSTFTGVLALAFGKSLIFRVFFQMFLTIIVLAILHGMVLLPIVLATVGPKINADQLRNKVETARTARTERRHGHS